MSEIVLYLISAFSDIIIRSNRNGIKRDLYFREVCMEVAFKEFNQVLGNINAAYHEVCVKLGISDSEFDILYNLCDLGDGCKQSAIYKNSGQGKSTINSAIKKMEKNGLIRIEQGTGRNTLIFLTEAGKELSAKTVEKVIEIENMIFHSWSKTDQKTFIGLNEKYFEEFSRKTDGMEMLG